jgi:hypothetical protein
MIKPRTSSLVLASLTLGLCLASSMSASAEGPAQGAAPAKGSDTQSDASVSAALKRSQQSSGVTLHSENNPSAASVNNSGVPVGTKVRELDLISGTTTSTGDATAGNARSVATPDAASGVLAMTAAKSRRRAPAPTADMTAVPNADKVVTSLAPKFAACAKLNQATQPGRVMIEVKVTAQGGVDMTNVLSRGEFMTPLATCVANVLHDAKFSAPTAGANATMKVPVYLNNK